VDKDLPEQFSPRKIPMGLQKDSGWIFKTVFLLGVGSTLVVMMIAAAVFWHFSRGLPRIITVADYRPLGVTRILGSNGKESVELGEFFKERRYLIPYERIPDHLIRAFISAEDDRFFEHPGINILSIIRAGIANFKAGHVVQGGSTITQQVAKSLLLTPERSFDRKIKEVILASRIEQNLTKQQILYLYLNQIYLGHGAYGAQAASRTYFRKDISEISIAEAALLAGMPQAPGKYSPLLNPKKAKERQLYVLRRMMENRYISPAQMTEAAGQPLRIFHDEDLNGKFAPYYVEHIRKYLVEKYGEKAVYEDGLTVSVPTTPELSLVAKKSLKDGLLAVDKRIGYRGPIQHLRSY
jgi:penicillin-binding protein 1A